MMTLNKELEETLEQAKLRANKGDKGAQYKVAMYYLKNKHEDYYSRGFIEYIEKSVEQGYCEAQREYANFLTADLSRITDENMVKAAELYYQAALKKDPHSIKILHEQSEFYKKIKRMTEQSMYYYNAHDSLQSKSAYLLAKLHLDDSFSQKNIAKSIDYYAKAAKYNHTLACNELGDIYYYGRGIEKNYPEAFKWFKQICDSHYGNAESYYSLGQMYHNELGVKKDFDQAINAYEKALAKGDSRASAQLGHVYRIKAADSRKEGGSYSTYYAGQHMTKAIQYYKNNENDKEIQNFIGLVYYESGDYVNAKQWFEKSARQGLVVAQSNLALTFDNGLKDIKNAMLWYEYAAKNGHAVAQHALALKYEKGEGVPKDEIQAFEWCLKAAENSHEAAKTLLKKEDTFFYRYNKLYAALNRCSILKNNSGQLKKYIDFEKQLGYEFTKPDNLINALDRRQDVGSDENKIAQEPYFQSYEFLGDAVLSAIVRRYIVDNKPADMKVGQMSNINDEMVKNEAILFNIAKELRLSEFIIKGGSEGSHDITKDMLADHMEALIGAVSKDGGFEKTEKLVLKFWKPYLDAALKSPTKPAASLPKLLEQKSSLTVTLTSSPLVKQAQPLPALSVQTQTIPADSPNSLSPKSKRLFTQYPLAQYQQYIKEARDINVNNIGKKGDTPIMSIIRSGEKATKKFNSKYLPIIECLYREGASLDKSNRKGKTARQLIEESAHKEVIKSKLGIN